MRDHWHTLTRTGKSPALAARTREPHLEVNLRDAQRAGILDGDFVEITSRRGKAVAQARVSETIRQGTCFLPFHWGRQWGFYKAANNLTLSARDPRSKQPELKACAVRIRRARRCPPMNKIEALKSEKDGLEIQDDLVRFAREGWKTIGEDDKERLKWVGVFMRRPTPGHAMMRIRMPNGVVSASQVRLLAQLTRESGRTIADVTTRQQLQLRWVTVERVPEIMRRLEVAGLSSLQTGMDNIRGIIGCPATGLTPGELIDTVPIAREFQRIFLRNKEFTNLPRKFNVTITGCREHCTGGETQDISMTPAVADLHGVETPGFNVAVGGKQGSGAPWWRRPSTSSCAPRRRRTRARPSPSSSATMARASRGARRGSPSCSASGGGALSHGAGGAARAPAAAGGPRRARGDAQRSHRRLPSAPAGLNYVGLKTPVGRVTADQLDELARLADAYGQGSSGSPRPRTCSCPTCPTRGSAT